MRRYADEVRRAHGVDVQIRVGLNSGEVVVRRDRQRPAHGLHGRRPDHPPGRADGAARRRRASILLTADTLRLAEGYVAGEGRSGPMPVKGLDAAGRGLRAGRRRRRPLAASRRRPRAG